MPQKDLETIIPEQSTSEREAYDIVYMWSPQYDANEFTYKMETDSQAWRTGLGLPREEDRVGGWD